MPSGTFPGLPPNPKSESKFPKFRKHRIQKLNISVGFGILDKSHPRPPKLRQHQQSQLHPLRVRLLHERQDILSKVRMRVQIIWIALDGVRYQFVRYFMCSVLFGVWRILLYFRLRSKEMTVNSC